MTPFVVFCVPSGLFSPHLNFWEASLGLNALLQREGVDQVWLNAGGDPYLAKVRNNLVSKALTKFPQMTHLFFLDDDVGFPPEAALELIRSPFDVTAGIYPKKTDNPDFPCELYHDPETLRPIEQDGWLKAHAVPTGFLCIKAHVLRTQAETAPTYRDLDGSICWNIFEMGFAKEPQADGTDGLWWGEDYAWCRKHRDAGGDIWVKPDIEFSHTGRKVYRGSFAERTRVVTQGIPAWHGERLAFFNSPAEIPEGWTTTPPLDKAAD